jgi:hypothetical protein
VKRMRTAWLVIRNQHVLKKTQTNDARSHVSQDKRKRRQENMYFPIVKQRPYLYYVLLCFIAYVINIFALLACFLSGNAINF